MTDEAKTPRERGILFSSPMVRAILEDKKTQTRRVVKELGGNRGGPVGPHVLWFERGVEDATRWCGHDGLGSLGWVRCPYGEPGDRLWVRETWQATKWSKDWETGYIDDVWHAEKIPKKENAAGWTIVYAADDGWDRDVESRGFPWRPGIHLPRWAARVVLEVESIGVERLHDITEVEARDEGIEALDGEVDEREIRRIAKSMGWMETDARATFGALWSQINGPESWDANPWVWAIGFKPIQKKRERAKRSPTAVLAAHVDADVPRKA